MKPAEGTTRSWLNVILIAAFLIFAAAWGLWKYQYATKPNVPVVNLQITTINPPAGRSLLPEQRRKFALEFGKKFQGKGMDASVTTGGDFHASMVIRGSMVTDALVREMTDNNSAISELRDMGFKHMIMTDGKKAWDVDLKN